MAEWTLPSRPVSRGTQAAQGSLGGMILAAADRYDGCALRFPGDGGMAEWSFSQLGAMVRELAGGLVDLGVRPGERVAILGGTTAEWTLADCAILCAGGIVVPIYQTDSPEECQYVLAHSGASAVVCEDDAQLAKVESIRDGCPDLEDVLTMKPGGRALTLAELRTRAGDVDAAVLDERQAAIQPSDLATIVYTSGTTGPPKGCMLTHRNCLAAIDAYERQLDLRRPLTLFMFLPLAHVLARVTQMVAIDVGATIAYWNGDPAHLLEDIADARPTHFPSVPRVFEKIHMRALSTVADSGRVQRVVFDWALGTGRRAREAERAGRLGPWLRARRTLADRLVLSKIRDLFGGELRLALTGAAPMPQDVLEFLDACGVLVLEGYGLTETCAAATLNTEEAFRFGSVGRRLPGTEVTTVDDGEVLLRGPNVFAGYYRDDRATREAFNGDWLRTGDLGAVDDHGFLRITGRKKDLIITSSGKNIAPANIEAALRESRWISQAVVHGDKRPYLVALLTLDPEEMPALAGETGLPPDPALLCAADTVHALVQADVDKANSRFARIEQVKRFAILDHDLSQAAGELTPTLKVKRATVAERYHERFDALYG